MNRIAVLFVVGIATTQVSTTAYAEDLAAHQTMAAECRVLMGSGNVTKTLARRCMLICESVDKAKDKELTLKLCVNTYADVTGTNVASKHQQEAASTPQTGELADIEGVYVQTIRGVVRVRAEDRTDWQTYCNEKASLMTGGNKFLQTVKANDRVRLIGISYEPSRANGRVKACIAKSAVIL